MKTMNIAGYKFTPLTELATLRLSLLEACHAYALKGTILLSTEGINMTLAGSPQDVHSFLGYLREDPRFKDMTFHETYSSKLLFSRLKIKVKKEIITLHQPEVNAVLERAPSITPAALKQWLDAKRAFTLLDTRNDYEVRFGTFAGSINLHLADFGEFPASIENIDRQLPIVMFCTGGIRCEKAALYLLHQGFSDVYQLDGGILAYFAQVGNAHYQGECFMFDDRIAVDCQLNDTENLRCCQCQGPVTKAQQEMPTYVPGVSCPACA